MPAMDAHQLLVAAPSADVHEQYGLGGRVLFIVSELGCDDQLVARKFLRPMALLTSLACRAQVEPVSGLVAGKG